MVADVGLQPYNPVLRTHSLYAIELISLIIFNKLDRNSCL